MAEAIAAKLGGVGFEVRHGNGVKVQDRNVHVLSHTTMPATTIECGFVDNAGDNAIFDNKFAEIVQRTAEAILSIAGGVAPNTVTPPSPSANVPELDRVLKYGCKGEDVRMMQERLNAHKANVGKADCEFGDKTRRGLHAFQQARINEGRDVGCRYNGNEPDDKCGELTWALYGFQFQGVEENQLLQPHSCPELPQGREKKSLKPYLMTRNLKLIA